MNQFFGYIRVSTVRQGEHGVSLQEQKDGISRYGARNGLEIASWFEERETAAKSGRPVFNEMMRRLKKGEAAGVIIHKIDRSARNFKDWTAIEELADRNIAVHFVNESLDLRSTGSRLAADVQAVVAAHYVRNLREETKKGFYGRLKQGIYPLGAPLGYLDRGGGKPKEIDPIQGPLVRKAFELYGTGQFTLITLRDEMERLGLRNRRGKTVSLNGLSTVFNNPFYVGVIRLLKTGETFQGVHEPLISTALFKRVRDVLEGRTNHRVRKAGLIFRRLLTCRLCEYSLIGERQKGHVYYRCQTKGCPTRCVREEAVLSGIREKICAPIQLSRDELQMARGTLEELKRDWAKEQSSQRDGLKLSSGQLAARLERLTDAFVDGNIEKELFEERKSRLLIERRRLEEAIRVSEDDPARAATRADEFLELCGSAENLFNLAIGEEKREIVALLTSNRTVEGRKLEFAWASPFDLIARRNAITSSRLERDEPRTWKALLHEVVAWFRANPEKTFALNYTQSTDDGKGAEVAA